ncbi:FAD-dependent monooxygenase [Sphingomonas sp.]|uniref:FAD-dependent monooxygenase n=1 Tax=Sphingomonas sp. TaxID=28214 RepID=UPI0025CF6F65|nr:FAD-dependent monooxygenase [Sphingomonas sp.]
MQRVDVLILGGGLVGLTAALALNAHGLTSVVVDPTDPAGTANAAFDGRASAIASASWRMLQAVGVASRLEGQGCKIRRIEVRDGLTRNPLDFTPTDGEALGTMVENRLVRRALYETVLGAKHVSLKAPGRAVSVTRGPDGVHATLDDGSTVAADLLIAADGRNSSTRTAAGIRTATWKYDHVAIISAFEHSLPHDNVAHEIFYPAGPFALLPMLPGHRSALVWTVAAKDAPGLLALSDHAFAVEAQKRTGGLLGELSAAAPRSSYPLSFHHAAVITAERLALVGDAAHGIHPIAGQGLNLGFRDVAALVEVLVEGSRLGLDLGDAQLLARYQTWRSLDTLMVATATDTLTRLFGIPGRSARAVRRLGIGAVQRIVPLKSMLMAEARGETGALPKLLQGATV